MKGKFIWSLMSLGMLLGGCALQDMGGTSQDRRTNVLTEEEIVAAGLASIQDDVYIFFRGDCPELTYALLPQCKVVKTDTVCRKANKQVKFRPFQLASGAVPQYRIEFEDFDPCIPSLPTSGAGPKVCNIKGGAEWPVGATEDMTIKYAVRTDKGCDLDPYLVLER